MNVIREINPILREQIWERIQEETEEMENYFSDIPKEIARKFEADKKAEYERLVQRLKREGVW